MVSDRRGDSAELDRGALHTRRSIGRDGAALVRSGNFESTEDATMEVPTPLADLQDSEPVRVLHVDDDPAITDVTATYLERLNDEFEVRTETTVVAALDRLDGGGFDCIISDYEMPTTDGLEFLEIVRERHPDLPFVLFTGKGSEEIASDAIAAGVTDYMQKGGGADQYEVLANRVENAVEQYRTRKQFWDALSWYRRLVEQGVAGVFVARDAELVYVNRTFADLFGYSGSELVGESLTDLADEADREALAGRLENCEDGSFQSRFTGRRQDGTRVDFELYCQSTVYEGEEAVTGIVKQIDGEPPGQTGTE